MKRIVITALVTFAFTALAVQAITQTAFSGAGVIESTNGGFKFPDGSVQLSAVTPSCTAITYLPYVISNEGVYCFTGNLETSMTSGEAITIEVDDVTIDLNGWMLDGSSAGVDSETRGVFAYMRKNITIKNGTIRGFFAGVILQDYAPTEVSVGHIVEDMRIENSYFLGMYIMGNDIVARQNQVFVVGSSHSYASGIILNGPRCQAIDNYISGISASGSAGLARAISISCFDGAIVKDNHLNDIHFTGSGQAYAVIFYESHNTLAVGNLISNVEGGLFYNTSGDSSTGKYMDNLTSGVTVPFIGGTPIGVND